jgi:hypothetical protein
VARVKEVHLGVSYTYSPAPYHSIKGEASVVMEVSDGDDPGIVADQAREEALKQLVINLAGVEGIHEDIYKNGIDPGEMINGTTTEEGVEDEDFDDFFSTDD